MVGQALFCFSGENGTTFSPTEMEAIVAFLTLWINKEEFGETQRGEFPTYQPLPNDDDVTRTPIMHTFDQFVANLGTDAEDFSTACK